MKRPTFNLGDAADLLDISRPTMAAAIKRGLPVEQRADRAKGIPWRIHIGDAMDWFLAEKAAKLAAEFTGERGQLRSAQRRKAVAEAIVAEIRADQRLRNVVDVEYAKQRIRDQVERISAELLQVSTRVMARWRLGMSAPEIAELVNGEVRQATRNLTGAQR